MILYIQGEPVTAKYGRAIQHAATTPEICQYYKEKHGWTDAVMETIEWGAFGKAQKGFTTRQDRNIHKYVHNWLPTGEVLDRRYDTTTHCAKCPAEDTRDHMKHCPDNAMDQETFYKKLIQQLGQWKTEPGLARLVIQFLRNDSPTYTGTETNQEWTKQLIQEQQAYGPETMWLGFLTQTWGDVQDQFHRREKHEQSFTGTLWATKLIKQIWKQALNLWKKRVLNVYKDEQPVTPHRQDLIKQIRKMYGKIKEIPNILRGLFKYDLRDLIEQPTKYLTRWLRIAKYIPKNEIVWNNRRKKMGQDIRKVLPMASDPPDTTVRALKVQGSNQENLY